MQPDLWEEINRWAADELRSTNGHIEFLLRQAVRERRGRKLDREAKPPGPDEGQGVSHA